MGREKGVFVVLLLVLVTGLLAACGKEEYIVEYGVDGYVYLARKIQSRSNMRDIKVIGEYIYYLQKNTEKTVNETLIMRIPVFAMTANEGWLDLANAETLTVYRDITFELPEGSGKIQKTLTFFPCWTVALETLA